MAKSNPHVGSDFDDFLAEDDHLQEATAVAIKRVIAWQIKEAMRVRGLKKTTMASLMRTSRGQVDRVLDETDTGMTLATLSKAAQAVGYRVRVELEAA